jgi:hypothetical protein
MTDDTRPKLQKTGALWRPKNPDSRAMASGVVTVNGWKLKIVVLANDHKAKPTDPDFAICSSERPEPDDYEPRPARREPDQARPRSRDDDGAARRYDDQDDRRYDDQADDRAPRRADPPRRPDRGRASW